MGCTCPVMDNNHGTGFFFGNDLCFVYNADCPVHSEEYFNREDEQGEIDFNVLDEEFFPIRDTPSFDPYYHTNS